MEMMLPGIAPGQPTEGAIRMSLLILRLLGSFAVMGLLVLSSLANSAVMDIAGCTFDVIQLLIVVSQLTTAYYVV
jgi:preprotein translocase subunit SecY